MSTGPNTPDQPEQPDGQQPPPAQGRPPQPPPGSGQPAPGYGQPAPGYGTPPMPGAPYGMPAQPGLRPDEEKLWAVGAHLGPLLLGFIAPLVVWLVFKDRSRFLDRQAKEALNMQITYVIYFLVAGLSLLLLVGILLLPVVGIAWLVLMVIATIKAANLEDYRYPMIFRFIS